VPLRGAVRRGHVGVTTISKAVEIPRSLLAESGIVALPRLRPLMKETEELFAVITGIILSTKRKTKGER
jgi:hypothetical protein